MKLRTAAAILATLLQPVPAVGGTACMTVTESTVLENDFFCDCSRGSAVEVQQFATLDLNGYQVMCVKGELDTLVVRLTGQGARLLNGSVAGQVDHGGGCVAMEDLDQTVTGVKTEMCRGSCIAVLENAGSANITANRIQGCGQSGILVQGSSLPLIAGNHIRSYSSNGVYLKGMVSNATVVDNFVAEAGSGIQVDGSGGIFEQNKIIACDGGISIGQPDYRRSQTPINNQVKKNVVKWSRVYSISVSGGNENLVSENYIEGSGILISGGDNNLIQSNRLNYTQAGEQGSVAIFVTYKGAHHVVESNVVSDAGGTCMVIAGYNTTVRRNDLQYCGGNGIDVQGDLNTVTGNNVMYCDNDGIVITGGSNKGGNNNTISQNKVESVSAVAFHDVTGNDDNDCGTNQWTQNEGSSFEPSCTKNYVSSPQHQFPTATAEMQPW